MNFDDVCFGYRDGSVTSLGLTSPAPEVGRANLDVTGLPVVAEAGEQKLVHGSRPSASANADCYFQFVIAVCFPLLAAMLRTLYDKNTLSRKLQQMVRGFDWRA